MEYRTGILARDRLIKSCTHNNFAILKFSLTQGLKQILPGCIARIASTKQFELCLAKQFLQSLKHEVPLFPTF